MWRPRCAALAGLAAVAAAVAAADCTKSHGGPRIRDLVVTLRGADGRPFSGLPVVSSVGARILGVGESDASGSATLPIAEGGTVGAYFVIGDYREAYVLTGVSGTAGLIIPLTGVSAFDLGGPTANDVTFEASWPPGATSIQFFAANSIYPEQAVAVTTTTLQLATLVYTEDLEPDGTFTLYAVGRNSPDLSSIALYGVTTSETLSNLRPVVLQTAVLAATSVSLSGLPGLPNNNASYAEYQLQLARHGIPLAAPLYRLTNEIVLTTSHGLAGRSAADSLLADVLSYRTDAAHDAHCKEVRLSQSDLSGITVDMGSVGDRPYSYLEATGPGGWTVKWDPSGVIADFVEIGLFDAPQNTHIRWHVFAPAPRDLTLHATEIPPLPPSLAAFQLGPQAPVVDMRYVEADFIDDYSQAGKIAGLMPRDARITWSGGLYTCGGF